MTGSTVYRRPLVLLVAIAALAAVACSEDLTTANSCPTLCPEQELDVQQVELEPVTFDTTVAGFPLLGTESSLLLVRAGDSLETRVIFRFDSLPVEFTSSSATTIAVDSAGSPFLQLLLARPISYTPQPVTVEAYDVEVAGDDTTAAILAPAFTPARRIGSLTIPVVSANGDTTQVDTLRIPLDEAAVSARVATVGAGLRVGLRITSAGSARLQLSPSAAQVAYVASTTDTTRLFVRQRSLTPAGEPRLQSDQSSFSIITAGTAPVPTNVLAIGGLPSNRTLLRFSVPQAIVDSAAILRASLVLTQRPVRGYLATDTLLLRPLAVVTSGAVTDLRRRIQLAANAVNPYTGRVVLPTTALAVMPGDSGSFEIQIPNLVGAWRSTSALGFLPELVLATEREGWTPVQVQFFSSEAAAGLRPKLRLSYVRRVNFDLP